MGCGKLLQTTHLHLELYSSHVAKRATQLERRYLLAVKTAANVYIYYRVNF